MTDNILIKLWHEGTFKKLKKKITYIGGSSDVFQVEVDKMSYFELTGYVMDYHTYNSQDFEMHYLIPGKTLFNGLVLLRNDEDVNKMVNVLGDDISMWPNAEHRNCARHIYAKWNKKHKGNDMKGVVWAAVRAYNEADFRIAMEDMKTLSNDAYQAFMKQNPKNFRRCYLNTDTKSDVVVNNMAETFNGYIIKSRSKHIINMLEDIKLAIMTSLSNNKRNMEAKDVHVCPRVQQKLEKSKRIAWKCEVFPSSATIFQVEAFDDVYVDLVNRTCTCRRWDLSGIPCYHVCAVVGFLGLNAEEFVHWYFKKDMYLKSYQFTIPPLPSEKFWPYVVLPLEPPPVKIGPGRPKKNRKRDAHEDPKKPGNITRHGMRMTCSICGSKEDNKRKCSNKGREPTIVKNQAKRTRGRPTKGQ